MWQQVQVCGLPAVCWTLALCRCPLQERLWARFVGAQGAIAAEAVQAASQHCWL